MLAAATLLIPGIVRTGDSLSRESSISSSIDLICLSNSSISSINWGICIDIDVSLTPTEDLAWLF